MAALGDSNPANSTTPLTTEGFGSIGFAETDTPRNTGTRNAHFS